MKHEDFSSKRKRQREYLNKTLTKDMTNKLNSSFESTIEIARIKHGNRQTIETLINEKALLLSRYLRNEMELREPRITCVC